LESEISDIRNFSEETNQLSVKYKEDLAATKRERDQAVSENGTISETLRNAEQRHEKEIQKQNDKIMRLKIGKSELIEKFGTDLENNKKLHEKEIKNAVNKITSEMTVMHRQHVDEANRTGEEIARLTLDVENLQREHDQMSTDLETANTNLEALDNTNKALNDEKDELNSRLTAIQADLVSNRQQLTEASTRHQQELQEKNDEYNNTLIEKDREYEQKINEMEHKSSEEMNKLSVQHAQKVTDLNNDHDNVIKDLNNEHGAEISKHRDNITRLKNAQIASQSQIERLTETVNQNEIEKQELLDKIGSLTTTISEQTEHIDRLNTDLENIEREFALANKYMGGIHESDEIVINELMETSDEFRFKSFLKQFVGNIRNTNKEKIDLRQKLNEIENYKSELLINAMRNLKTHITQADSTIESLTRHVNTMETMLTPDQIDIMMKEIYSTTEYKNLLADDERFNQVISELEKTGNPPGEHHEWVIRILRNKDHPFYKDLNVYRLKTVCTNLTNDVQNLKNQKNELENMNRELETNAVTNTINLLKTLFNEYSLDSKYLDNILIILRESLNEGLINKIETGFKMTNEYKIMVKYEHVLNTHQDIETWPQEIRDYHNSGTSVIESPHF
jgi:chromosome segregation ATPase